MINSDKSSSFAKIKTMVDASKDMYIVQIDGYFAAIKPYGDEVFRYARKDNFCDFITALRKNFPDFRLRCIRNKGIEDYAQKRITSELKAQSLEVLYLKQRLQR